VLVTDLVSGDLVNILQEVNRLRVQLERCISSNDRLRYALSKCGAVAASDNDLPSHQHDGL